MQLSSTVTAIDSENRRVISRYHMSGEEMRIEYEVVMQSKKDPAKFKSLYDTYYEPIFNFIYQRLDDKELAYDTTSQVFLKALTNLHKYEFKGVPFSSWLYRIARSEVYQLFRDEKIIRAVNIDTVHIHEVVEEMNESWMEEYRESMLKALKELEEDELNLIEMRFFEKRPFKEIAEILLITENNAKVKVYRLLDRLKKKLLNK